ncbi:hypothetical protein CMUS01_16519 [Colletotrichum musicola]|uniref:Uncharacterized protein n=1 Tax=Colletotrichum musicola TaxID=2175873 RepID=A0A8H6MHT0_9PEZI|nr:hypothetical protein CMUS01_16519 [Colletotrichum musicola]
MAGQLKNSKGGDELKSPRHPSSRSEPKMSSRKRGKYNWAEPLTAQQDETSTSGEVDELSLTDVAEPSAAQNDLGTAAPPFDPFYGSFATKDDLDNAPPLESGYEYPINFANSAIPYTKTSKFSSGNVDYVVAGTVNDVPTSVTPDNGSDTCILSSSFAAKLGVEPIPGTEKDSPSTDLDVLPAHEAPRRRGKN